MARLLHKYNSVKPSNKGKPDMKATTVGDLRKMLVELPDETPLALVNPVGDVVGEVLSIEISTDGDPWVWINLP